MALKDKSEKLKSVKKSTGNFIQDFCLFISQANVIGLAVSVVIGGAITLLIKSFVDEIIMPILTYALHDLDFTNLKITLADGDYSVVIAYGNFIGALISCMLMALCVFILIRIVRRISRIIDARKFQEHIASHVVCSFCLLEVKKGATRCPHCTSKLNSENSYSIIKENKDLL